MTELREKTDVMQDDGGGVEDQKLLKIKWPFVHFILQIYMFIHTTRQKKIPKPTVKFSNLAEFYYV